MKLSEKYLSKITETSGRDKSEISLDEAKIYAEIRSIEAQQELLIRNPYSIPQARQLDLLASIVGSLQQIAEMEKL